MNLDTKLLFFWSCYLLLDKYFWKNKILSLKKSLISYSALLSLFSGISNVYAESYQVSGNASATGTNSIAIGDESRATATGSVALGYDADSINFYTIV